MHGQYMTDHLINDDSVGATGWGHLNQRSGNK